MPTEKKSKLYQNPVNCSFVKSTNFLEKIEDGVKMITRTHTYEANKTLKYIWISAVQNQG